MRVIELFDRSHFSSVSLVVCLENRKQREEKYELAMIIKFNFSRFFIRNSVESFSTKQGQLFFHIF